MNTIFGKPSWRHVLAWAALLRCGLPALLAVEVGEALPAGAQWPSSAAISIGRPDEGNYTVEAKPGSSVAQTITPDRDIRLGRLLFAYKAREGGIRLTLRIQEVPEGAKAAEYAGGKDLLGETPTEFVLKDAGGGVLSVTFSAGDAILLRAGKTYAVELRADRRGFALMRRGSDYYRFGNLYVGRRALNYPKTRDIMLAVEAATAGPALRDRPLWPSDNWTHEGAGMASGKP